MLLDEAPANQTTHSTRLNHARVKARFLLVPDIPRKEMQLIDRLATKTMVLL